MPVIYQNPSTSWFKVPHPMPLSPASTRVSDRIKKPLGGISSDKTGPGGGGRATPCEPLRALPATSSASRTGASAYTERKAHKSEWLARLTSQVILKVRWKLRLFPLSPLEPGRVECGRRGGERAVAGLPLRPRLLGLTPPRPCAIKTS